MRKSATIFIGLLAASCAPAGYHYGSWTEGPAAAFTVSQNAPAQGFTENGQPIQPTPSLKRISQDIPQEPTKSIEPKTTPIEPKAILYSEGNTTGEMKVIEGLAQLVRDNDFRCDSISSWRPMLRPRAFVLGCNKGAYTYDIEDKGGHWIVTVE